MPLKKNILEEVVINHKNKCMENNTYLTYQIGDQIFASDSKQVRRILEVSNVQSLKSNKNTITLNGDAIVVFKLYKKMNKSENTDNNCLMILETNGVVNQKIGVVVSKIKKLVDEEELLFIDKPQIGISYDDYFIEKYAKMDNEIVGLINLDKILNQNCKFIMNQLSSDYSLRY